MIRKFFEIQHDGKSYYVDVQENKQENHSRIFVGASFRCVDMSIYGNKAHIDSASYYPECVIGNVMEKKKGTVHLVKVAMEFALTLYPNVKPSFTLDDQSFIECNGGNKLRLQILYWSVYNVTWYEKNFGAKPYSDNHEQKSCT